MGYRVSGILGLEALQDLEASIGLLLRDLT